VEVVSQLEVLQVVEPAKRKAGVILSSVGALVDRLRNEAKVI
jgi:electron transfer flavoprotein beta subunit